MAKLEFLGWGVFSVFLVITFILLVANLALGHTTWRKAGETVKLRALSLGRKTLSIFIIIVLIPFVIGVVANITSWLKTREHVEITLGLNGWEMIGMIRDGELESLKLTCDDAPVKNAIKVSWQIMNTGSTGIEEFETLPTIIYPSGLNVAEAKVSWASPLLKIDRTVSIDSEHGVISISNLGIFNSGDFFEINIYITDVTDTITSDYFSNWQLIAKSVNIEIKKDLTPEDGTYAKRDRGKMLSKSNIQAAFPGSLHGSEKHE